MSETRNVVVLGASYAGIGAAHYFLKHVYPSLKTDANTRYKVILVNPSTKMFQRIASPRAAASTTLIPEEKLFLDIEPGFKQYGEAFQFIQGSATFWDPQTRTVELARVDGKEQILAYHALILATGSKTYSPFLSNQGTQHGEIQSALKMLHHQLETATSIVIAGGGPAGVEVAGEIGEYLNGAAGWFSSRPSKPRAHISLYTSSNNLLPALRPTLGKQAEKYLNRVGVDVLYGRKLASTSQAKGGRTRILLENGKEFDADIFIPAMGAVPMSDFVPERLRTEKGLIKMNARTMRVDEAGPRVYALGDVGSAFRGGIMEIYDATPVLMTNIKRDLLAGEAKPTGSDRIYKPNLKETQLVPVGMSKGVGAVFGWRLPSFFVWMIKGRDYLVSKGPHMVSGAKWEKEVEWKPQDG